MSEIRVSVRIRFIEEVGGCYNYTEWPISEAYESVRFMENAFEKLNRNNSMLELRRES